MVYLIAFLIANLIFEFVVEVLNLSRLQKKVPEAFAGIYTEEKYAQSQEYLRETTWFSLLESGFSTAVLSIAIVWGLFDFWDLQVRSLLEGEELRGVLFAGGIGVAGQILSIPFDLWSTFVIEEKFGFNRTSLKTFIVDRLKGWLLGIIVGGPLLYVFLWIWISLGSSAWLWSWLFLVTVQLFIMFIAPVTIMPLFNKFQPLTEGSLKSAIEEYAKKVNFKLQGIFTMDGSKRSTKANAFFTGFGRFRRVVLFDTLIAKHTQDELLAVLAHEVGHYKLKHIFRQLALSLLVSGVTLYLMSIFASHPFIFSAFQLSNPSIYAGLLFFGILYSPISLLISIYSLYLSRKYEFEADEYSKKTYGHPEDLASALKKLSADNLSNLNPHPLKVFLEYTHPPVLHRISRLT